MCQVHFFFSTNSINNTGNSSVFHLDTYTDIIIMCWGWFHSYMIWICVRVREFDTKKKSPKSSFLVWNAVKRCEQVSSTERHIVDTAC